MTRDELISELQCLPSDVSIRWFVDDTSLQPVGCGYSHNEYELDHMMIAGHGYEVDVYLTRRTYETPEFRRFGFERLESEEAQKESSLPEVSFRERFFRILRGESDCPQCGAVGDEPCSTWRGPTFLDGFHHEGRVDKSECDE